MAVTPQTNTTLAAIAEALRERDSFVIGGHVSPDGDCIGSQLALAWALRQLGKDVTCVLARDEAIAANLRFLPGADGFVWAGAYEGPCDCFVAVDVPTPERLGDAAAIQARAGLTVTVDHHAVPEAMSALSYTDPDAASTTMLVWELAGLLGAERDRVIATCAYTGLVTDTGRFQYQNTDADALAAASAMVAAGAEPAAVSRAIFQMRTLGSIELEGAIVEHMALAAGGEAALSWLSLADFARCGACKADAEPLIDTLRSIAGVRVACVLREQEGDVRGSLRAKDDTDVAAIAREFGGGGHTAAAGFTFHGTLAEAVDALAARLGIARPVRPGEGAR